MCCFAVYCIDLKLYCDSTCYALLGFYIMTPEWVLASQRTMPWEAYFPHPPSCDPLVYEAGRGSVN